MRNEEKRHRRNARICAVVFLALFLGAWQMLDKATAIFLSRPSSIAVALKTWFQTPSLRDDIPTTLEEAALGFCAAMVVAIVLATLLASSKMWAAIVAPYVAIFNSVPKIALAPLFIAVFGTGISSKVYFILALVFIIPFFSLFRALTAVDPVFLNHARMLGATRRQLARDVYLPAVIGSLAAVLRATTQFCLLGAVFSELIASSSGLGFEIETASQVNESNFLFAGVVLVALIGFTLDVIIRRISSHFVRWRIGM
jgi:NitT/TauT family transport system permease protein